MRHSTILVLILSLAFWTGCRADREPDDGQDNVNENVAPDQNENDNESSPATNENGGEIEQNENSPPDAAGGTEPEKGMAAMERFESAEELEEYFKQQVRMHNSGFRGFFGSEGADDSFDGSGEEPSTDGTGGATGGEGEGEGEGEGDFDAGDAAAPPAAEEPQGTPGAGGDGDEEGSYSTTTIQEEGVDEADVVKTDGQYLYVLTNDRYWGDSATLHIVGAVPANDLQLLGGFNLDGWGNDLYLVGDRVVALSSRIEYPQGDADVDLEQFIFGVFLDAVLGTADAGAEADDTDSDNLLDELTTILEALFPRPETVVTVIDVADRSSPTLVSQTAFQGDLVSSRMIDGVLRLVVASYPDHYYSVLPLGMPQTGELLGLMGLDTLLPDFERTDASGEVTGGNIAEWDAFFRPGDPDGFGVTTVITLDTATPDTFDAVGIVAQPGLIYASTEALYFTDTDYYFDFRRVDTDIYKFAFEPDTVTLVGSATVPGRILNQYSMGEYDGYLRVATTTDDLFVWETGEAVPSSNAVYVLGEEDGKLAIVGSIEDLGVGEEIQSARFIGTRGYVVTFERIDPLFTLDLREPTDPQVAGELKVPGYSTFIVPMDQDHLLTVGVYVDPEGWGWSEGVQLSIFDVSDLTDPLQIQNVVIGGSETYSEATWNPKAFTYFAAEGLVALPIEHYGYDDWGWEVDVETSGTDEGTDGGEGTASSSDTRQTPTPPADEIGDFRGLFVYGVSVEGGFDYLGRLSTDLAGEGFWSRWPDFTRGVFIEDHVYAVTNLGVVSSALDSVDTVVGQVELPFDDESDDAVFLPDGPESPPPPSVDPDDEGAEGEGEA